MKRSFTIHNAWHSDGCKTKFSNRDYTGVYVSSDASGAARKALTQLCRVKNIHGQCALYISMRETTRGSSNKQFLYKLNRVKLTKPIPLQGRQIYYTSKCKSVKNVPKCPVGSRKTPGRKRSVRNKKKHSSRSGSRSISRSRSRSRSK